MTDVTSLLGLLLLIPYISTKSQETKYVAVSSNLTLHLGECEPNRVYRIHHETVTIHFRCGYKPQIPDKFKGRLMLSEPHGYITVLNIRKSDAGYYKIERTNSTGKKDTLLEMEVMVLDPAWIHELSRNITDESLSLSVGCSGECVAINWKRDGGDLLDRHWLSDDNVTLIIPNNVTGIFTVYVANRASADTKHIILIKDPNGKSGFFGPIMYLNISKVIWGEAGDHPSDHMLFLQRDISNISVVTEAEKTNKPLSKHGWFVIIALLIFVVIVIGALVTGVVMWRQRGQQSYGEPEEQNSETNL